MLKAREDLKAGEYQFKAHASLRDVVATIVEGRVVPHQLTIPEGLTSEQIVARLLEDDVLTGNIKEIPREGSLLPDTYNFTRGVTREQMIQRMQQAQQRVLKEVWDHHSPDLPIKTPEQLVDSRLASVEKETGKPEERTRVAAVFINRLKQKMRLQSDPTIIYGLVGGKGTLGRPIMKSEIEQPTPYNTYQIDRLAAGPDRQSGPRLARSRRQSGPHPRALFRRRRHRRSRLRRDLRAASEERRPAAAIESDQKDQAPADASRRPRRAAPRAAHRSPLATAPRDSAPRHNRKTRQSTTH